MTNWIKQAFRIAGVETRRELRQLRTRPLALMLNVVPLFIILPVVIGDAPVPVYDTVASGKGAYQYGKQLAAGDATAVVEQFRTLSLVGVAVVAYVVTLPTLRDEGAIDQLEGLLVTVSPRAVALGELLSLLAVGGRLAGIIILGGAIAFGAGAGSFLAAVMITLAGGLILVTIAAIVYPTVLGVKLAFVRYEQLRERRLLVGGPLVATVFYVGTNVRDGLTGTAGIPLTWYADLGLLGSVASVSPVRAAVVVLAAPLALGGGVTLATRFGTEYWYADRGGSTTSDADVDTTDPRLKRLLRRVFDRPTAAAVWVSWQRVRRQPKVFVFGALILTLSIGAGTTAVERNPALLPYMVALYGGATFGAGMTMNPIGNEGSTLPATVSIPGGGRAMITGHTLAAGLPGGVIVGAASLAAGTTTTLSPTMIAAYTVFGVVCGVAGPAVSVGFGSLFPEFQGLNVTSDDDVYPPRLRTVMFFLLTLVLVSTPAIAGVYPNVIAGTLPLDATAAGLVGIVLGVAALGVCGGVAVRYAVQRVETYELDR